MFRIRLSALALITTWTTFLSAQNLVPNPSFENVKTEIKGFSTSSDNFHSKIHDWFSINEASPNIWPSLFNDGHMLAPKALSGDYMGSVQAVYGSVNRINGMGSYLCATLDEMLTPNKTYYVEYGIRRAKFIDHRINENENMNPLFGILFFKDTLKTDRWKMIEAQPQIKGSIISKITDKQWFIVGQYFTPQNSYNKMCLGQFWDQNYQYDLMTQQYLIDDVVVKELRDFDLLDKNAPLVIGNIIPLNNVEFVSGKTELAENQSINVLNQLVSFLNKNHHIRVRINGHTDNVGSKESNLSLSQNRAQYIADYLIESGVDKNRVGWQGFADEKPIADNTTEEGRAKNRRVEFEIIE